MMIFVCNYSSKGSQAGRQEVPDQIGIGLQCIKVFNKIILGQASQINRCQAREDRHHKIRWVSEPIQIQISKPF